MSKPLMIIISGEPLKQDRPRTAVIKGHVVIYDKKSSKDGKKIIAEATVNAIKEQEWVKMDNEQPLALSVTAYFSVPKSWPKKKKAEALAGKIRPTSKPDTDNVEKIYMDGLVEGGAMNDDASIVELHGYKYYGESPRTVIILDKARVSDG